ncbi:MAG: VWA domain-containing protein [Candidatus Aminicenantes bacterium]|nr:VWA domain-containing protein [Candidatus Aminicenantes bacterium]
MDTVNKSAFASLGKAAIVIFLSAILPPLSSPEDIPRQLQHEVGVTLKLIQVVVLDKSGNPVTDLRKEDFVLTDNGKRVELTEFERHALSIPSDEEEPAKARVAATPLPAKPALLNRKLFFIFDFGYSDAQGVVLARKAALKYLESSLLPTDEVAVLTYSLFGRLRILEYLTTSHAQARRAVEKLGVADAFGSVEGAGEGEVSSGGAVDARTATAESRASTNPGQEGGAAPAHGSDARYQARRYIAHMTALAQALRYVPGQKTFVLFSKGIPFPLVYPKEGGFRRDLNADIRVAHEAMLAEFATSNIVVYPIDTTELDAFKLMVPESARGAATLRRIAQTTGGEYLGVLNNSEGHFRKIQTLTAAYYVLG